MKISDVLQKYADNKRVMVLHDVKTKAVLTWGCKLYEYEPKVIVDCMKYEISTKMINHDQATIKHFYENEAFDAVVIKVEDYWLQNVIKDRQGFSSSIESRSIAPTIPIIHYVEDKR